MSGENKKSINQEAKIAAARAMRVPGQIRATEVAALYKMGRRLGHLVEIGCLHGRSTAALVQAAAVFKAKLTSIDPFYVTPGMKQQSSPGAWAENLRKVGLPVPELIALESHEAAKIFEDEISFLFIDGNHDYEHVKQDIEDWSPKIKVGGVMAFHDMFMPHISGVAKAVTEWWLSIFDIRNVTWKLESMTDFTIAFRRIK
jgi:predicted O-methyltransferase YrrM